MSRATAIQQYKVLAHYAGGFFYVIVQERLLRGKHVGRWRDVANFRSEGPGNDDNAEVVAMVKATVALARHRRGDDVA